MMTYPHKGSVIFKSRSLNKVAKRCYKEFKNLNDKKEGIFIVTDLDNNVEYQFKVKNKKIYNLNNQDQQDREKLKQELDQNISELDQENVKILLDHLTKQQKTNREHFIQKRPELPILPTYSD